MFLIENPQFQTKPCDSFREFIDNPYYLGLGKDVYERIIQEGEKIVKGILYGGVNEGIMLCGIGSGKSFLAECISVWFVHYLLCMENPHQYFHMAEDKPIVVVNMGINATQAKNVIFSGIKKMIEVSPFFQQQGFEILQTEIRFKNKNIAIYCGNSRETMPIGMNVIMASLDEAAWYLDNDNKCIAEDIYNTIRDRIVSRFGQKGFMFVISAPRYVEDFITRHYQRSIGLPHIYSSSFKTWEAKDKHKMSKETFDFNAGNGEIWKVPMDFYSVAQSNPEKFMRDFGAKPSLVLEAFDRDAEMIERIADPRENPIDENGSLKDWFKATDSSLRYIHIDLGLKKDACGFAMGKQDGYDIIDNEKRPKVFIDMIMQIKAKPDSEIDFSDIRQIIYTLQDRGFNIAKVTYDGWQSIDSIQILKVRGINAETLSIDRDLKAYDTMKEMIHTKRFNCFNFAPLTKEYKRLELVKGKKVDHPNNGSKDVSDAVAGVCFNIAEASGGGLTLDFI